MKRTAASKVALLSLLAFGLPTPAWSAFPQDEPAFNSLVSTWVQVGMSTAEAKAKFEAQGLKVYQGVAQNREWLIGSQTKNEWLVCQKEWRAVLTTQQSKVTEVKGFVFLTCL